jgi:hypothetical protein
MARVRRRRVLGSLLLVALLLVPALAIGHHHATHTASPCATCVATHHSPLASTPVVVVSSGRSIVVDFEAVALMLPAEPPLRRAAGRGPPSLLLVQGA